MKGKHKIAFHKIVTILLRSNKRYYDSDSAYIKNIFDRSDQVGHINTFSRYLILCWLSENKSKNFGKIKGYHPISGIVNAINEIGISKEQVIMDVIYLVKGNCIVTEDFRNDGIVLNTLVKITPSGEVHLQLSSNITYLSAIAEECHIEYDTADRIRKRINHLDSQMNYQNCLATAIDLYKNLDFIRSNFSPPFEKQLIQKNRIVINLENIWQKLESAKNKASEDPWFEAEKSTLEALFMRRLYKTKWSMVVL